MAIRKRPVSPRQKMINLLYVVLMAMLALNVSTEVLESFSIVEDSLVRTTIGAEKVNRSLYDDFEAQLKANPNKVRVWFERAMQVKRASDSLYNYAQELKLAIARQADGANADVNNIVHKEDLEAASHVMLSPTGGQGKRLFEAINKYREGILEMISDKQQKQIISDNLSTKVPQKGKMLGRNWQEYMFEDMPVSAAVTLLTKLQSDIRYAEGEVLHTLLANVDVKDVRVNKLEAFVIPEKTTLYPGEKFSANIVMAAIDSTQTPDIYINGIRINNKQGKYSFTAGGVGQHSFSGYITMRNSAGDLLRRNFTQKYEVIPMPSTATIAADLMNVLYAGYQNPISVSVSGIPHNAISVTMSGGTLNAKGDGKYTAIPSAVGKDVVFNITAIQNGKRRELGTTIFRVRKLPDPTAYINIGTDRFKGGGLSKASLMGASGIRAAIDDGILDIDFKVVSFETIFFDNMGNAVPMASSGSNFTERQREEFRRLSRSRRFYITGITAIGPDGITRKLQTSMEVILK